MIANFPYHQIPDGNVFTSHHYLWASAFALFLLAIIWDNQPHREPIYAAGGILLGLFAFVFVWRVHHVLGAVLCLVGTAIAVVALLGRVTLFRGGWPLTPLLLALLLMVIASDDVVQHAFGWETPLDYLWNEHLRHRLPSH